MLSTFKHLTTYFGEQTKAVRIGHRTGEYIDARRVAGAAEGSIRIELALLARAFKLAKLQKRLGPKHCPVIQLPPPDPKAVRRGFFRRPELEALVASCDCGQGTPRGVPDATTHRCWHLPRYVANVILFLFFCPWRIGMARRLEWRDYSPEDAALTCRAEIHKTGYPVTIPVDHENTPELMAVLQAQQQERRSDCPFIFHGGECTPRFDKHGGRKPCLGDIRKVWATACVARGYHKPDPEHPSEVLPARTPHDLRRSGAKHYIAAGVDPHTVMQWTGHRTMTMLLRYHIIDLEDLRRAGKKASYYAGEKTNVIKAPFGRTGTEQAQLANSNALTDAQAS
jgi:integrase